MMSGAARIDQMASCVAPSSFEMHGFPRRSMSGNASCAVWDVENLENVIDRDTVVMEHE